MLRISITVTAYGVPALLIIIGSILAGLMGIVSPKSTGLGYNLLTIGIILYVIEFLLFVFFKIRF